MKIVTKMFWFFAPKTNLLSNWIPASPVNGAFARSLPTMSFSLSSLCITSLSVSNPSKLKSILLLDKQKNGRAFYIGICAFQLDVIEVSGNKRCFCSSNGCYKKLIQKPIFQQDWCPRYPRMLRAKFD